MELRVRRPKCLVSGTMRAGLACAVMAVCLSVGVARGAVERLPEGLTSAATLTTEQKQQVQKFVTGQVERIKTGDAVAVEEARQSMVSPFLGTEPTIGFRLEFGRAGAAELKRLARDADVHRAMNAILVCGASGTSESIDAIAEAFKDPRPAIRATGAAALREVILTSAGSRVRSAQGLQAIKLVGSALGAEKDPIAALALVASLEPAKSTDFHGPAAEVAVASIPALVVAMPVPVGEPNVRGAEAIQRALGVAFTRLIDPSQAAGLNKDYFKAVVKAGAYALGFASRHAPEAMSAGSAEGARQLGLLVAQAEQCVLYGEARATDASPGKSTLKEAFDASVASGVADQLEQAVAPLLERAAKLTGAQVSDFGA